MENDNYKPNRYARRHPKAVVRPFFAAILRSPLVVQPMMFVIDFPDCKEDRNCLLKLADDWKYITTAELQAMIDAGANVNAADDDYHTPLHFAVLEKNSKVISVLCEAGANPGASNAYHRTPLHMAASMGAGGSISALIKSGTRLNPMDSAGDTPLDVAKNGHFCYAIELLEKAGAKTAKELRIRSIKQIRRS